MSPLPERRKSAGEIARLRESIGVPSAPVADLPGTRAGSLPVPGAASPAPGRPPAPVPAVVDSRPVDPVGATSVVSLPVPQPSDSRIPTRRRNPREIEELRRRDAMIAMQQPVSDPRLVAAHPVLVACGYLFALAGASCHLSDAVPAVATGASALCGLMVAGLLALRCPSSRHHGAFIAVIAVFVLVFGTLHFLPQIQHAP